MRSRHLSALVILFAFLCVACEKKTTNGASGMLQSQLDAYCTERGKEALVGNEKLKRVEAFYSSKINTCVQVEVTDNDKDWSLLP
jgi:hypothetical protein